MIVCAFSLDRWGVLRAAVESLRAQSVAPCEVVLVVDHNPELEARARAAFADVRVLANTDRQGLSGARNTGVRAARGDVIAFLDDDARAAPDWLERLLAAYADPAVLAVGGAVEPDWAAGRPRWFPPEFDWVVGCTHSGLPATPSPVRNLVGANMSFRAAALATVGGFDEGLGRVGALPAGCEETELCIRIARARPGSLVLHLPAARVDHAVPAARASWRYFADRCRAEGRSKARVAALTGAGAGLAAERAYVRRTLPLGVLRGLAAALRGDPAGAARALAIVAGLALTTAGYAAQVVTRPSGR